MQNSLGWRKQREKRRVSRTGPAPGGWGNWNSGQILTSGQLSRTEEKHPRLRVKQLICGSLNGIRITQRVLATAICTPDKDAGPLKSIVAGSWHVGIGEQSQGKVCYWLCGDSPRGSEGGDHMENVCGGKLLPWRQGNTAESSAVGGTVTVASLSPHTSTSSWTMKTPERLSL